LQEEKGSETRSGTSPLAPTAASSHLSSRSCTPASAIPSNTKLGISQPTNGEALAAPTAPTTNLFVDEVTASGLRLSDGLYAPTNRIVHFEVEGTIIACAVPHDPDTATPEQQKENDQAKRKAAKLFIKATPTVGPVADKILAKKKWLPARIASQALPADPTATAIATPPPLTNIPTVASTAPASSTPFSNLCNELDISLSKSVESWVSVTAEHFIKVFGLNITREWLKLEKTLNFAIGEVRFHSSHCLTSNKY
jgi:hypothetical protein